jgi:hypothetical protein
MSVRWPSGIRTRHMPGHILSGTILNQKRLANASTVIFATTGAAVALPAHPALDLATTGSTSDRFVSARRRYALRFFVCGGQVAAISLSAF